MIKIFLFIFLLYSNFIFAQQEYFNKRINDGISESGIGIIRNVNDYSYASVVVNDSSGLLDIYFKKLDIYGNVILQKQYSKSQSLHYSGGFESLIKVQSGGYIIGSTLLHTDGNSNILLYRLNDNFDTIWTKEYGDSAFQSIWKCKPLNDGGFIITGQTCTFDSLGDMLLIRIDSSGNVLWQKNIGGNGEEIAYDIEITYDNGYVLCGSTTSYGQNVLNYFPNFYVVKTDSLGNKLWDNFFGDNYEDRLCSIIQLNDGSFRVAGMKGKYDPGQYCCHGWTYPYLSKISQSGQVVWEKTFGEATLETFINTLKKDSNENLLLGGTLRDTVLHLNRGLLIKTVSNGDSIIYQSYTPPNASSEGYFYGADYDLDKGFIAIGWIYPNIPDTGNQDTWIIKTDSLGCINSNCFTRIYDINNNHLDLNINVFPNPFTSNFVIEISVTKVGHTLLLQITNTLGVTLWNYPLQEGFNKLEIPGNSLPSGIYLAKIFSQSVVLGAVRLIKSQ